MTNLKPPTLIFYLEAVLIIIMISIPSSHCRNFQQNNIGNLIDSTCKKTPNYNVCLQSLRGSSGEDVNGLAQIMVKVMKAKANEALNKIHELQQKESKGPKQRIKTLNSCADKYNAILVADIPEASEALQKGDPKFAEDGANDAANEATYCESEFSGKSPLTKQNNAMHDAAAVTAAIVRLLL